MRTGRQIAWLAMWSIIGVVAVAAVVVWGPDLFRALTQRDAIVARVKSWGPWGPVASIAICAAQVVVAPLPGQTVGLANGYLFGVALGTLYSMLGLALGSALVMFATRRFGRPFAQRLVPPEKLARWDDFAQRRGPVLFFLLFLLPFCPDDILCFVIGLSPLHLPSMLLLTLIGRLPGMIVANWIGATALALPWWAQVALFAGAIGLGIAYWRYHEKFEGATRDLAARVADRWRGRG